MVLHDDAQARQHFPQTLLLARELVAWVPTHEVMTQANLATSFYLLQTRLRATNGLGFEPWAQKLVQSAGYKKPVVVASQGVKTHSMPAEKGESVETDPHTWQEPTNVLLYVRNIAAALG